MNDRDDTLLVHWMLSVDYIPDKIIEDIIWKAEYVTSQLRQVVIVFSDNPMTKFIYKISDPLNWKKPSVEEFRLSLATGQITVERKKL